MSDVIDLNANRAPVVYTVTIAHHYDGTLEFKIEDVADDERSRETVFHAFRRISGADKEIEKLTIALKQAVWSDSEECKVVSEQNADLHARIAELETALVDVTARLVAAVSLLERGGKKAAPSNKMFDQMIVDYKNCIERSRAALNGEKR